MKNINAEVRAFLSSPSLKSNLLETRSVRLMVFGRLYSITANRGKERLRQFRPGENDTKDKPAAGRPCNEY